VIVLPRALARQFRAVLRRLASPGSRCPIVVARAGPDGLVLESALDEAAVRYHQPGALAPESIAFSAEALTAIEGTGDDVVRLDQVAPGKGMACWSEGGVPRQAPFATKMAEAMSFPEVPRKLVSAGEGLLAALSEAVQTAAHDCGRQSLMRLLLRGSAGEIVATDGHQLLVQRGITFPWKEDLLVPALPVFTGRGLPCDLPAGIGRTATHVALHVEPWTFLLAIDTSSRFPDYQQVVPRRSSLKTRLAIAPEDAAALIKALPRLPGKEGKDSPVTIDIGAAVCVRAREEDDGDVAEMVLPRSSAEGPPLRLVTNRRFLLRALKLGFNEVLIATATLPLVCRDSSRLYLWMPLDAKSALPPASQARMPVMRTSAPDPDLVTSRSERSAAMSAPHHDGPAPRNGEAAPQEVNPAACGIDELIGEAEALRTVLAEAMARASRLAAGLKRQRRTGRALEAALASLRQFQPPAR
jgi:hypothetical protein